MAGKLVKANIAIHTCAVTSAVAAGAWSLIPIVGAVGIIVGLDTIFLTPMTIGMVIYIGKLHGQTFTYSSMAAGLGQFIGMVLGVNIARSLATIVPGWGTVLNATIAAGLQETIGWGAYLLLEDGGDIKNLKEYIQSNRGDINKTKEEQSKNSQKIKSAIKKLSEDNRKRYFYLKNK